MDRQIETHPQLIEKWSPFLEGIKEYQKRNLIAVCMENVDNYLMALEAKGDEPVGRFSKYAVPLSRRVLHDLALQELISFQPLAQPDGKVFYMDFEYGTTEGSVSAGDNLSDKVDKDYASGTAKGGAASLVNLEFTSAPVTADAKKLTGRIYIEDEQDLMTYYGVSGEVELIKVLAKQIIREVNKKIITDMLTNASAGDVSFDVTVPASGVYSTLDPKVYRKQAYEAIIDADNNIFKKRFVTPNWIVAGPDVAAFLEKLEDFTLEVNPNKNQMATGLYRFGTLKQRWNIYKYAYMPNANEMLMGYKGSDSFETGYVYAPYIAAYTTPAFVDPNTFKKTRGMMSRSAEKLVSGDYYSKITLTNL